MYAIMFYEYNKLNTVCGSVESLINLANVLENDEIHFKVCLVGCGAATQDMFGFDGFKYWMDDNYVFGGK